MLDARTQPRREGLNLLGRPKAAKGLRILLGSEGLVFLVSGLPDPGSGDWTELCRP